MTTAKIARAAGIGEGTIFRVFDDKDALLAACTAAAARRDTTVAHLESISPDQPLAARLAEAAETMRGHMTRMGTVAGALAAAGRLERPAPGKPGRETRSPDREAGLAAPRAALAAFVRGSGGSLHGTAAADGLPHTTVRIAPAGCGRGWTHPTRG